jgi:hypothetical protein
VKNPRARVLRRFWTMLRVVPRPAPPRVERQGDTVRVSWSRRDRHLDMEIGTDGMGEWFFSAETGAGRQVEGTAEDREELPIAAIVEHARTWFPG